MVRRLRWRLARLLLGYAPVRVPEAEGVYVVCRYGPDFGVVITADKFRLRMQTPLASLDTVDLADFGSQMATTTGRFVGTVKA